MHVPKCRAPPTDLIYPKNNTIYVPDVGGFQPENIREDLIWNRLANLKGRPGGNIGLDLVNEFLNNDFKGTTKRNLTLSRMLYSSASDFHVCVLGLLYS